MRTFRINTKGALFSYLIAKQNDQTIKFNQILFLWFIPINGTIFQIYYNFMKVLFP